MPKMSDFKRELQEAKRLRLPWYVMLLIFCIGAPATFLFALYGRLEIALPLLNMVGVFGFIIALKWRLKREVWFWITTAIIVTIHLFLLFLIPWTEKWVPALAIGFIDSVDICLIIWTFVSLENVLGQSRDHDPTSKSP